MNAYPSPPIVRRAARRGVLLLVVLSLLTLFLMLGAAYVVSATRAREAARAYARLTFAGDEARVPHARLLDGVLLRVLRGGAAPTTATGPSPTFESLLADKYGTASLTGTATGFSTTGSSPVVLSGTLTLPSMVRPFDLNGRVLSFVEPGRPVTSHRIIRAEQPGGANAPTPSVILVLDASSRPGPFVGPKAATRAVVNGREFDGSSTNEPYDGFDVANPFLAQVGVTSTISRSIVSRISYFSSPPTLSATLDQDNDLIPDAADNDNDGVYDGLFMDFGIPDFRDANGNTVNVWASVLIVDLDGRFNVNAHDSLPRLIYAGTSGWTTLVSQSVPMGSGYGPAEVNGMSGTRCWTSGSTWTSGTGLFPGPPAGALLVTSGTFSASENPTSFALTGGPAARFIGIRSGSSGSRYADGQSTPQLSPVQGKYGERAASSWGNMIPNNLTTPSSASFALPGRPAVDDDASRMNDRRADPTQGPFVGYGVPPIWWTGTDSAFNWQLTPVMVGDPQPGPRGTFNSPPDLHGRMRTTTGSATGSAIAPRLSFAKAEWANTTPGTSHESKDDPYELRLDTRLGFGGLLFDPTAGGDAITPSSLRRDNPFTAAEMEPVLRPYDIDANRLPPRLPAMLGSAGEEARLKVTTDSWDTTAITGSAATVLATRLSGATGALYGNSPTSGIIGGEVARGERFDLNRPLAAAEGSNRGYPAGTLTSGTYHLQRAAYCKDLYTLLLALAGADADALAQWAANVAEFRDADSRIMPFEYDVNPWNGWNVDGDVTSDEGGDRRVVWGAERPEIVIQEALAWRNAASGTAGMCFTLHRPWNAVAYGSGSTASIAAEPCDYALDVLTNGTVGSPQNIVNVGKKAASDLYSGTNSAFNDVSGTTYPIWRIRIVAGGSTSYVRFDTGTAQPGEFVDSGVTSGNATPKMAADATITFVSGPTIITGSGLATGAVTLAGSGSTRTVAGMSAPAGGATATLSLERLSDPTLPLTPSGTIPGTAITGSAVWFGTAPDTAPVRYITVDTATVTVNETGGSADFAGTGVRRATAGTDRDFWQTPSPVSVSRSNGGTLSVPQALGSGSTAWLPWPNRPFVSSAELLLVPQGTATEILQNYQRLSAARAGSVGAARSIPVATHLLFDAVHVPTRFAGIHRTTTRNLSAMTGIFNVVTTVNQCSSFREPGRVNLNTVLADDVWNAVVAGPLPAAVTSRSGAMLTSNPAQTMVAALALAGGAVGTVRSDTTPQLAVSLNPLHEIYTATRLANTVTTRSNVFAIWITLRESVANDPDSVRYRRAFYIVDRSIPVAFENGRDNNVWDCVRVRRIIE